MAGWMWCAFNQTCLPAKPDCKNYDCETGKCYDLPNPCPQGQTFCYVLNTCVAIPDCCVTYDDCGNCLTTVPGASYCKLTASCYAPPTNCLAWDCVNKVCQDPQACGWGQTWCPESSRCVDIPFCCLTYDNCGRCTDTLPFTGVCPQTGKCYFNLNCEAYDCVNNICLDPPQVCPVGYTFCPATQTCNPIIPCCQVWDSCGNCLEYLPNAGFCSQTNSCYVIPDGCPRENFDCVTQKCICGAGQSWCKELGRCVSVPSCCLTHDDCGNCLTFQAGQNYCSINGQCFSPPTPTCTNLDCASGRCLDGTNLCPTGSTLCPLTNTCLKVPGCCATYDACGSCLTTIPGTGWCRMTGQCYIIDQSCKNYDCLTNTCLDSYRCQNSEAYCPATEKCRPVPACCVAFDPCLGCLKFAPMSNWCEATQQCYFQFAECQDYDCATQTCKDLKCGLTQTYCSLTKSCVEIPTCCLSYDNCGNCLEAKPGWTTCPSTGCKQIPADCLTWDCLADRCSQSRSCPAGQVFCVESMSCVAIPPCCQSYDSCGRCTGFFPGMGWCAPLKQCYEAPLNCQNYDCVAAKCLDAPSCPQGQEFCELANMCVPIQSCCILTDGCGQCATFQPNQGWCSGTSSCFTQPADCLLYDCISQKCIEAVTPTCAAGQEYCSDLQSCVPVPSCCDLTDGCGHCLTYKPGTAWCSGLDACYDKPSDCIEWDCLNNICLDLVVCNSNQKRCPDSNTCVDVAPCCEISDDCGNCLTYKPWTMWCSAKDACSDIPIGCLNYDCVEDKCLKWANCGPNQSFCPKTGSCVAIPACCAEHDDCGTCTTYQPNSGWCSPTDQCYWTPTGCVQYDCVTNECIAWMDCPAGQSYCPVKNACVAVPPCCVLHDNCGTCTTYKSGTGWCSPTNSCFDLPTACTLYDCQSGECMDWTLCTAQQTYCDPLHKCVDIPSCCEEHDACGNCMKFKAGTAICSASNQCYNVPTNCPPSLYDCATGVCSPCPADTAYCASSNSCVALALNCATQGACGACVQCNENFFWDGASCVPYPQIAFCSDQTKDICNTCQSGYLLSSNGCYVIIPNCASQFQNDCTSCAQDYTLQNNGCILQIANCLTYSGSTCTQCADGYQLFNNQCWAKIQNCLTQEGSVCKSCAANYILISNNCVQHVAYCSTYSVTGCATCWSNFLLYNNQCFLIIPNCATQLGSTCSVCQTNFVLYNNVCQPIIPYCAIYGQMTCQECVTGYLFFSSATSLGCYAINPTCATQLMNACTSCPSGYILQNGACTAEVSNCHSYIGAQCAQCISGFLLQGNLCYAAIPYCASQVQSVCNGCSSGYVLSNNACVVPIANCATYNGSACISCVANFVFFQGACYAQIPFCQTQEGANCLACIQDYLLNGSTTCFAAIPYCQTYNGAVCTACQQNYLAWQGGCVPAIANCLLQQGTTCVQCNLNYILSNNACWATIWNCASQTGPVCNSCNANYLLGNNFCYAVIPNCATYDQAGACLTCFNGHILNNNVCYAVISNCSEQSADQCLACVSGYNLLRNACVMAPKVVNCQTFDGQACLTCVSGYVLTNGYCWPIYCASYDTATNACTSCLNNAPLVNGLCYYIESCATYNTATSPVSCSVCSQTFVLSFDKMVCLGPAHFILQRDSSLTARPAIGYYAKLVNGEYFPAWGGFTPGYASNIWYFAKNPANGFYTIKLYFKATTTTPYKFLYLATDGQQYYFTSNPSVGLTASWAVTVLNVSNVNLWSIQSALSNKYLGENLAMVNDPVYFKII